MFAIKHAPMSVRQRIVNIVRNGNQICYLCIPQGRDRHQFGVTIGFSPLDHDVEALDNRAQVARLLRNALLQEHEISSKFGEITVEV